MAGRQRGRVCGRRRPGGAGARGGRRAARTRTGGGAVRRRSRKRSGSTYRSAAPRGAHRSGARAATRPSRAPAPTHLALARADPRERRVGHAPAPAAHAHGAPARHPPREDDAAGARGPHRPAVRGEVDTAVLAAEERVRAEVEEARRLAPHRRHPALGGVGANRRRRGRRRSTRRARGDEDDGARMGRPYGSAGAGRTPEWRQSVRSCAPSVTARYRSFAAPPVSSATTEAAGRARAPASTSRRTASIAPGSAPVRGGAAPMTSTTSPRGGLARVALGQRGRLAAHDLLVELRQLAADRDRSRGIERREHLQAKRPRAAATRTPRASPPPPAAPRAAPACAAGSRRSASARRAGRSPPARRSPPTARAAPRPPAPRRCSPRRARSPGRDTSGMPASETSATTAPSTIRPTSSGVRSRSLCSW